TRRLCQPCAAADAKTPGAQGPVAQAAGQEPATRLHAGAHAHVFQEWKNQVRDRAGQRQAKLGQTRNRAPTNGRSRSAGSNSKIKKGRINETKKIAIIAIIAGIEKQPISCLRSRRSRAITAIIHGAIMEIKLITSSPADVETECLVIFALDHGEKQKSDAR